MIDLGAVRERRDAYRDAFARALRANEPNSDRADDRAAAQDAWFAAAVEAASDVWGLVDAVEQLRGEVEIQRADIAVVTAERDEARADVREAGKEIRELQADLRAAYSQIEELP